MMMLKTFENDGLYRYLEEINRANPEKLGLLDATDGDVKRFFDKEIGKRWLVAEYMGSEKDIEDSLSLLAMKIFRRYFLEIMLPEEATLLDAQKVIEKVEYVNVCDEPDMLIAVSLHGSLDTGEVGFRLVVPRYTYADMWDSRDGGKASELPDWL